MKKITWMLLALILGSTANAQISVTEDFENEDYLYDLLPGWDATIEEWDDYYAVYLDDYYSCEGYSSLYGNLYSSQDELWVETPTYSGANEDNITVGFTLQITDYWDETFPDYDWGTALFQYSTDGGTTWEELATIGQNDIIPDCNSFDFTISSDEFDSDSDIKFRWDFSWIEGDWEFSIDSFYVSQEATTEPCDIDAPTGDAEQTLTEGQTLADLDVTADEGAELTWYADEDLENEIEADTEAEDGTTYYVVQTEGDCTSDALAVTVTIPTSLNQAEMAELKIYPNPANDIINVTYKSTIESVTIMDLTGRKVHQQAINTQETTLNIQPLSTGTYLMNIQTTDGVGIVKFIKK